MARLIGVVGMLTGRVRSTEYLPLLSRGKHRGPLKGACVMEYASYLAGERWSDHPACTHPLLAELARQVNDFVSDESRQTFVELVPEMIGVTGSDLRFDVCVALRVARIALPVVAESRQQMMATAILAGEWLLADLNGRPGAPLSRESSDALDLVPRAAAWARQVTSNLSISRRAFRRNAAPTIVRYGVQGVAHACVPDPDRLLRDMLVGAIADCRMLRAPESRFGPFGEAPAATTWSPQEPARMA